MTGAPQGRNVGVPGYSYDFVVRLFAPLLAQWGELMIVTRDELESAVSTARRRQLLPVHVSFLPLQDVRLAAAAPNVVVPAWEYPDIPNHDFDGNPQNNWVATAERCDGLMVGGPFTAEAFRRAGVKTQFDTVPVPTPEAYFELPAWQREKTSTVNCAAGVFCSVTEPEIVPAVRMTARRRSRVSELTRTATKRIYTRYLRPFLWNRAGNTIRAAVSAGIETWRGSGLSRRQSSIEGRSGPLQFDGVVYTSIFNPIDGRKNWQDLLTGFLCALKDCSDATLVLKLITGDPRLVYEVWNYYRCLGIPHRCRVAIISEFLGDEQLLELAAATTYYVTTTRAEGNCLPLMNYLAAGRPGISPRHTAIADYFDEHVGFVVASHPEPTAFPHDSRLRRTTTWHRLVWPSLVEQFHNSYKTAKDDGIAYDRLVRSSRERMLGWSHPQAVAPRLHAALDRALEMRQEQSPVEQRNIWSKAA